jgi:hypothetical protein
MRSDRFTQVALVFVAVTLGLLISLPSGLIFLVAFADWRNQSCLTWPDAGNCSDALGTMAVTGGIVVGFVAMAGLAARHVWRLSQMRRHGNEV